MSFKKLFKNEFNILTFIGVIIYFLFDIVSVLFLLTLYILPYLINKFNYSSKYYSDNKNHGINNFHNLRLGGFIIIIFLLISVLNSTSTSLYLSDDKNIIYLVTMISIIFLGFIDDILGGVHYLLKFNILFFSILILILINNEFIFQITSFEIINSFLQFKVFSIILTVIIISGFINATNISDGANGILSGISSITFLLLFEETNNPFFFIIFKFLLIFFIYNTVFSRIILGDTGSYFLGFLISTVCIYFYNNFTFSAGILGSILIYPCLEVIVSIIRRLLKKRNPLKPDNKHLHNLIFYFLENNLRLKFSNSLTGVFIVLIFSFPSYLAYQIIGTSFNNFYWLIFLTQCIIYITIYFYLSTNKHNA